MNPEALKQWSEGWEIIRGRNGLIVTLSPEPVSIVLSTERRELVLSHKLGEEEEFERVLRGEEGKSREEQIIQEAFRRALLWLKQQPKEPRLPFS